MAAVWFGALFGLGALAVHASLLESLVRASGIDSLVPAAAPPLGVTARILIALALAALGGIIGAVIGTLLARSKPAARARRAEAAAAKAAARAAEAEAQLAAAAPAQPALALEFAEAPNFIDFSQLEIADEDRIEPGPVLDVETEATQDFSRPLDPVSFPLPASFPAPGGAAAARLTSATLDSLSHVELIERLALSLQKRREEAEARAALGEAPVESAGEFSDAATTPLPPVPSYYPPAPEGFAARFAELAPALAASTADPIAEPVALFPEQPPAPTAASQHNPDGTERALRDALAALQRMSGAA